MKLYTVKTAQRIIGMSNISGPLTEPTPMEFNNVLNMVKRGYVIYEHNPANLTEKVKVTLENINTIRFNETRAGAAMRRIQNRKNRTGEDTLRSTVPVSVKEESKQENQNNKNDKPFYGKHDKNKHGNQGQNNNNNRIEEKKEENSTVTMPDGFQTN